MRPASTRTAITTGACRRKPSSMSYLIIGPRSGVLGQASPIRSPATGLPPRLANSLRRASDSVTDCRPIIVSTISLTRPCGASADAVRGIDRAPHRPEMKHLLRRGKLWVTLAGLWPGLPITHSFPGRSKKMATLARPDRSDYALHKVIACITARVATLPRGSASPCANQRSGTAACWDRP
jgi:hypothetical protein